MPESTSHAVPQKAVPGEDEKLGFAHENLEGWIPALASESEIREALEKAFDYRGDLTVTLKSEPSATIPRLDRRR